MGMDVIGKKKDSYFRNNVWWWRPLWAYCMTIAPAICGKVEHSGTNDGDGLNAEDSKALALALKASIADGTCAEYETRYNAWRLTLPREKCDLCSCTGIRTDKVGTDAGMPSKELSIDQVKALGRTQGWCNGCDGVGTKANWQSHYPFSVENVAEFAEFLETCEGFEIW
jgi:hypothetical protein